MAQVKEQSSLASYVGELYDYWTPAESRLLLILEKNPWDYDSWMTLIAIIKEGQMVSFSSNIIHQSMLSCHYVDYNCVCLYLGGYHQNTKSIPSIFAQFPAMSRPTKGLCSA